MKLDQWDTVVLKPLKSDWSASEAELIDPSVLMMSPHGFLSPKQLSSHISLLVSTAADEGSLPIKLRCFCLSEVVQVRFQESQN